MPPQQRGAAIGGNLALSAVLALLSYVPFEWVAKGSLLLCAFLFIVDPIPPISRLLSIVSLFVVYGLTKAYNHHSHMVQEEQEEQQQKADGTESSSDKISDTQETTSSDTSTSKTGTRKHNKTK